MGDPATATAIAAMGTALGPEVLAHCLALYTDEQARLAAAMPPLARDCAYGPDPRQRLDLYGTPGPTPKPIVLWVHGGGFVTGDKGGGGRSGEPETWANASVGRMLARAGCIGAVMNYRLAPVHGWPAGAEDVGAAVAWLRSAGAVPGGGPQRIVLAGTSAGAIHIGGFLQRRADHAELVQGAVLLSGLYGYTGLGARDQAYYGDPELYPLRMPRKAVVETRLPLLVACAEFDPPRFQAEFLGLMKERLEWHGAMPRATIVSGHNHYTMAMHLGTADQRLANDIVTLVKEVT